MSQLIVDRLAQCLESIGGVSVERGSDQGLTVPALSADGFTVLLRWDDEDDEFTIATDHWHGHHSHPIDAVMMFVQSLTPAVREKSVFRGKMLARSWLEKQIGDEIRSGEILGMIFVPFWRAKRTCYRQNDTLSDDQAREIEDEVLRDVPEA